MNHYETFGLFLKAQRKAKNLTMNELTDGICTVKTLHRIEDSICEPSVFLLDQLSKRLNLNLFEIYSHFQSTNSGASETYALMNHFIVDSDIKGLRRVLSQISPTHYQENSLFLSLYYYGLGLCSYLIEDNCQMTQYYVTKGLSCEKNNQLSQYSSAGYRLLNLQANLLMREEKYQAAEQVLNQLVPTLETNYIEDHITSYESSGCINRIYQSALASQVIIFFYKKEYSKTQQILEKGMHFSLQEDLMRNYPVFLEYQAKLDYIEGRDEKARQLLTTAVTLYLQQGHQDYVEELMDKASEEFARLHFCIL